ncbi:MAG: GNAT family N-acetyltransferase [Pseudomonadota bacterium]
MPDVLEDLGYLALGSRLKRLAERLQSDAAVLHSAHGFPIQPSQFPLIAALDRYGDLTVNDAVEALGVSQPAVTRAMSSLIEMGVVETRQSDEDRRSKTLSLSKSGQAVVRDMKVRFWPAVESAARDLCEGLGTDFVEQIGGLERAMEEKSLQHRVLASMRDDLSIVPYSNDLAQAFYDITAAWVETMFSLEQEDIDIISDPQKTVIDPGGEIIFVRSEEAGIIGTCALMKIEEGCFELTKMGVLEAARGRKAGEFLLEAILDRAKAMDIKTLFLLTNKKCGPAIHLYEKLGFEHDEDIMRRFGARYERCDVAMLYRG